MESVKNNLNMTETMTELVEDETMIQIPAEDFAWLIGISNDALKELKKHREAGTRIESDYLYEFIQHMGDKPLHKILLENCIEPEPICCLTCGSCDGCDCEEIQAADAMIAYV